MITASHNPKDYNGIKVYGEDGAQLSTDDSARLSTYIDKLGHPLHINLPSLTTEQQSLIHSVPSEVREDYFKNVQDLVGTIPQSDLKVVFTSLHGTSVPVVPDILSSLNFNQFELVASQCEPDSDFSSVASANQRIIKRLINR